ncbi:hypothetical protein OnM2_02044 [Erysiphe neolycopersici]|uniref:Secreted protein n=1 Tax=Erysiphe neolycopersici TaxID=212602 RepID=A0A420HV28_9PEZI|nr:hypothetical protein OnM2_02044 [Erysiphe neolycopersici]
MSGSIFHWGSLRIFPLLLGCIFKAEARVHTDHSVGPEQILSLYKHNRSERREEMENADNTKVTDNSRHIIHSLKQRNIS